MDLRWAWIWGLVACTHGGTDEPADTGAPLDSATGDTAAKEALTELTFALEGAWQGTVLGLREFDLGPLVASRELASTPATSAEQSLRVGAPRDLIPMLDFPELSFATVIPYLHEDDGDGVLEPGENYVGVSPAILVYLVSEDGSNDQTLGWDLGWTASTLDQNYPLDAIPLPVHPRNDTITLAGEAEETETRRLVALPLADLEAPALLDEPLPSPTWSLSIDTTPPAADAATGSPYVSDGAFPYALLVYVDSDGSGDWSPGDKIDAELCDVDDEPVSLVWFPPSEDLTETIFRGGRTGWVAGSLSRSLPILTTGERAIDGLSPGQCGGFAP